MNNVEKCLQQIFLKHTGIDFDEKTELRNQLLFGEGIGMPARELVYVYFDMEREMNILIPESFVIENRFDTYEHILECAYDLIHSGSDKR